MAAHASLSRDFSVCPDHHLWRNGRLWWVAFTVHLPPWHKERVRLSLGTDDVREARRRRDDLLRRYPQERGCTLSLRCAPESAPGRTKTARSRGRRLWLQPRGRQPESAVGGAGARSEAKPPVQLKPAGPLRMCPGASPIDRRQTRRSNP